jgi:hypothetical protein
MGSKPKESSMSKQSELLAEVSKVLSGDRARAYGSPIDNLDERTASLWQAYLDVKPSYKINGIDVCNMMILLKIARTIENIHTKDNYADIAGYAGAAWEISEEIIRGVNTDEPLF